MTRPNIYNPYYLTRHPGQGFKTIEAAKEFAKTQPGRSHTIKHQAERGRVVGSGVGADR
jgi:hypothetical protein